MIMDCNKNKKLEITKCTKIQSKFNKTHDSQITIFELKIDIINDV